MKRDFDKKGAEKSSEGEVDDMQEERETGSDPPVTRGVSRKG